MSEDKKVLTLMIEQFLARHRRLPNKVIIAPVALVALGLKRSVGPAWEGVLVECRLFEENEVTSDKSKAVNLGLFVKEKRGRMRLVSCDLKG